MHLDLALLVARVILAPAFLMLAAWFIALRRARPDVVSRWFTVKVVVLFAAISLAAVASGAGSPPTALVCIGVADFVAWFLALRLWIERRPRPLAHEDAAQEARRLADMALDLAASTERRARAGGDPHA